MVRKYGEPSVTSTPSKVRHPEPPSHARKREEAEALRRRGEQVIQCKSRREDAKTQRLCLLDARRREVVQEKESERAQLEGELALLKGCHDREVQAAKQKHVGFMEEKRSRATEWTLVKAFNCHHTSLSRAINKHNTRQRQSDAQQGQRDLVNRRKMQAQSQRKLIQAYLEDRYSTTSATRFQWIISLPLIDVNFSANLNVVA